jgi:hypothetical protein
LTVRGEEKILCSCTARLIEIGVGYTRRRMHLCMQDDQISKKIIELTPADMDRLPHLENTPKKFSVVNNLVCQLGLHLSRACLVHKGNRPFLLMHSPSS